MKTGTAAADERSTPPIPVEPPPAGPYATILITPGGSGAGFALDRSAPHFNVSVDDPAGDMTLQWGVLQTEARLTFRIAGGYTLTGILLGVAGDQVPVDEFQQLWAPLVATNPARSILTLVVGRPPTSVITGQLSDFSFVIEFEDRQGKTVTIDPKIYNEDPGAPVGDRPSRA